MPPNRHHVAAMARPVAPQKTERTHEENQERAYIAASRRSDRSLEARIESARRASEIHKKRTGRALRVTEQDVVNEEMYEEEDDDLPTQYQRLTAHLQTGSMHFNRKLQDYLATQHAMRSHVSANLMPQSYPYVSTQFPHHFSPATQYAQNMQGYASPQMLPPQMFHQSPQTYRHNPYTLPARSQAHQRSSSIPNQQHIQGFQQPSQLATESATTPKVEEQRRMSMPTPMVTSPYLQQQLPDDAGRPPLSRTSTAQSSHHGSHSSIPNSPQHTNAPSSIPSPSQKSPHTQPQTPLQNSFPYPQVSLPQAANPFTANTSPLSAALPPEAQQFMGSMLDPSDPSTPILMQGSNNLSQPWGAYSYNPNPSSKQQRLSDLSATGMNQTLSLGTNLQTNGPSDGFQMMSHSSTDNEDFFSSMAPSYALDMSSSSGLDYQTGETDFNAGFDFDQFVDLKSV